MKTRRFEWSEPEQLAAELGRYLAHDARTVDVSDIAAQVGERGDAALLELTRRFDAPEAEVLNLRVGQDDALAALAELDPGLPRHTAAAAYLHERDGDLKTAARLYAEAARKAPDLAERDHLMRQAARLNARLRG